MKKRKVSPEEIARRAAKRQRMVALAVACPLCPAVTPEQGVTILGWAPKPTGRPTVTARTAAEALAGDEAWVKELAVWLEGYWSAHGHGPSWRVLWTEAPLWPEGCSKSVQLALMQVLGARKLVDGLRTPFGLKMREEAADGPQ